MNLYRLTRIYKKTNVPLSVRNKNHTNKLNTNSVKDKVHKYPWCLAICLTWPLNFFLGPPLPLTFIPKLKNAPTFNDFNIRTNEAY